MATIRKRNGKYQVQVRLLGSNPISKIFTRLDDAKAWTRLTEVEAKQIGLPVDPRTLARITVGEIVERYRDEVVSKKRQRSRYDHLQRADPPAVGKEVARAN